jgi:hypothetical protein
MSIIRLHPVNAAGGESGEGAPADPATPAGAPLRDPQWYHRPGTLSLPAPPPLSVYVHLPWCLRKCPYCDFNSHEFHTAGATPEDLPEQRYLDAVRADLERSLPLVWGRTVHTVFIGGGTPSLFSPDGIARLLSDLRMLLPLAADCEITLEANPGTFEKDRFRAFAQAGVNRLSIGVQTFHDAQLRALGRVHDAAQARAAAEEAARSFETFNLDLMYALPGQTVADLDADLDLAFALGAPHLSLYHLTLEPNTVFAKRPPANLPDDDTAYDMLDRVTERSAGAGFVAVTTSTTGNSGTTSAWARARTASCRSPTASRARCAGASRACTWRARWAGRACPTRTTSRAPSCRSSSCSTRCGCARASRWRCSPSAAGCRRRRSPGRWTRPSGAASSRAPARRAPSGSSRPRAASTS